MYTFKMVEAFLVVALNSRGTHISTTYNIKKKVVIMVLVVEQDDNYFQFHAD